MSRAPVTCRETLIKLLICECFECIRPNELKVYFYEKSRLTKKIPRQMDYYDETCSQVLLTDWLIPCSKFQRQALEFGPNVSSHHLVTPDKNRRAFLHFTPLPRGIVGLPSLPGQGR